MSGPTLSICMPTRNRQRHLQLALGRLFHQAAFPFPIEVVVSDNASIDETPAVVQSFVAQGLPLRYYRMPKDVSFVCAML